MNQEMAVLLVEDHQMMREYIAQELRAKGYSVIEAETVLDAEQAIDASVQEAEEQTARKIGAIILDSRFPYGDQRDETESMDNHRPAAAVVNRAKARGLGRVMIIGFSTQPMKRKAIGLRDEDEALFTDVGKYQGGPREILEVLASAA